MKIDFANCTEEELWKYVGTHLAQNGIDAVLVGGAVVSIYSKGAYHSGDLDFVIRNLFAVDLPTIMKSIGFVKSGRHYKHSQCKHLFVEFPPGPLGLGQETKIEPKLETVGGIKIKILSPTDCIKDRLASYIHFKVQDTLDQAVLVAHAQPFDMQKVEKWCKAEGAEKAFEDFKKALKK